VGVTTGSYTDYARGLKSLLEGEDLLGPRGRVVVFQGPSDYLIHRGIIAVRERLRKLRKINVTSIDARELDAKKINLLTRQRALFEPTTLYVVRRCEEARAGAMLGKILAGIEAPKSDKTHWVFGVCRDEMYKDLGKVFSSWKATVIPCVEPARGEIVGFLAALARRHQLPLRLDAVEVLLEAVGTDLFRMENELARLSLVYAERASSEGEITAAEIAPHLGLMRADTAYEIEGMMVRGRWADAEAQLYGLIQREGDSELIPVLHLLARHCRNGLRVAGMKAQRTPERDMERALGMPTSIARLFVAYAGRGDPARFERALERCREVDVLLKSSPMDRSLMLSGVLEALREES
jgi:DNA polymerase III delta subunit